MNKATFGYIPTNDRGMEWWKAAMIKLLAPSTSAFSGQRLKEPGGLTTTMTCNESLWVVYNRIRGEGDAHLNAPPLEAHSLDYEQMLQETCTISEWRTGVEYMVAERRY